MLALGVLAASLAPVAGGRAAAQEATGWIALQVYECPSGMTAATLEPWSCWVVTEEVETQLWSIDGTPLLGFGDAYFDGWTWTWQYLSVGSEETPVPYQIVQTVPPAGSIDSMVQYAPAEGYAQTVWLSGQYFGADLHVYNFFE